MPSNKHPPKLQWGWREGEGGCTQLGQHISAGACERGVQSKITTREHEMLRAKCNRERYCGCCCRQLQGFGALRVHSVRRLYHPLPPPLIRRAVNVPLHPHHIGITQLIPIIPIISIISTICSNCTCARAHLSCGLLAHLIELGQLEAVSGRLAPSVCCKQAVGKAHDAPHNSTEQVECNHTHQLPATHCIPEKHLARAHNGGQLQASSSPPTSMLRQPQGTVGERGRRGRVGITNVTSPAGTLLSPVTLTANLRSCACMRA